jgi:dTMP kinase
MTRGTFITFEGIDGCGKSTQVARVAERLSREKIPHLVTREPGGTRIGEQVRAVIMAPDHVEMCDACELLLYLASRAQHMHEVIVPALGKGEIVLCDRFQEATIAYQCYGRGIARDTIDRLNAYATGGLSPDLTLLFDLPVDAARERLAATGKQPDRLEGGGAAFFERVRAGYLALAAEFPARIRVLDARESIDTLAEKTRRSIMEIRNRVPPAAGRNPKS